MISCYCKNVVSCCLCDAYVDDIVDNDMSLFLLFSAADYYDYDIAVANVVGGHVVG